MKRWLPWLALALVVPIIATFMRRRRFVPTYDFFRLGEPIRSIADNRSVPQAPRGGIAWIKDV